MSPKDLPSITVSFRTSNHQYWPQRTTPNFNIRQQSPPAQLSLPNAETSRLGRNPSATLGPHLGRITQVITLSDKNFAYSDIFLT